MFSLTSLNYSAQKKKMKIEENCLRFLYIYCLFSVFLSAQDSVEGRVLSMKKPDPNDAAGTARWLVAQNSWGVLKYVSFRLS